MSRILTCEQVSDGHPDKICDQVADAIVTDCLVHDKDSRVAIECLLKDSRLIIAGELTSKHQPDYRKLVGDVLERIGKGKTEYGRMEIINPLDVALMVREQSPDIALGVDKGGAGDQGIMFGYATNETPELLPVPFAVATKFLRLLKNHPSKMFRADAKAQVSFDYSSGRITTFLCSVQHSPDVEVSDFRHIIEGMMVLAACEYGLNGDFVKLVNPTGRFVVGGSFADCGVTGRKLACDTYGGIGRIGGGAHCVDGDTEFLTPHGFKKIRDYQKGDLVGEWDFGKLNFVEPLAYIVGEAGVMYHIQSSDALDMVLSENHDVVMVTSKGNVIKKQVKQLFENGGIKNGNHGFIPIAFRYSKEKGNLQMTDDEIRLQVAFCADGTIIRERSRDRVRVKKERKKERMRELLLSCGINYTETEDGEFSIFWFTPPMRSKSLHSCFWETDSKQLKVIADEVQLWDGVAGKYRTTHKEDADFIQFVFMAAYGTNASIRTDDRVGGTYGNGNLYERKSVCYEVYRKHCTKTQIKESLFTNATMTCELFYPDDSKMYCFRVPSGMLVLRRNNRVFVTGNSGKDPSKVDRSAAYMARKIARDIVQAGYAEQCEIQIAYAIGMEHPVSVNVDCFGTEYQPLDFIQAYVGDSYDLTPRGIINRLHLLDVDYNLVSSYGHFGKPGLPWEE